MLKNLHIAPDNRSFFCFLPSPSHFVRHRPLLGEACSVFCANQANLHLPKGEAKKKPNLPKLLLPSFLLEEKKVKEKYGGGDDGFCLCDVQSCRPKEERL